MMSLFYLGCATSTQTSTSPSIVKCQVSVTGASAMVNSIGGSTVVTVSAQPECAWSAAADVSWIADIKPSSGQGAGQVTVSVAPNTTASARQGNLKVNDAVVAISQAAAPCEFNVSGPTDPVAAAGGAVTVSVSTLSGCTWSASSSSSWLAPSSPTTGNGPGSVKFTAAPNTTGGSRSGTVVVAGVTVTISQRSATCVYTINPTSHGSPVDGDSGSVSITTIAGCGWTATTDLPWITITAGAAGSGSGAVAFSVAPNPGGPRTGVIHIADQTFTVNQAGTAAQTCSFTLGETAQTVASLAGAGVPIIVTTTAGCGWTAASGAPWIAITAGTTGNGSGSVSFSVAANTGAERTGTLTIAGQTYTVTQSAPVPCNYSINPTSQTIGSLGGVGSSVAVTTTANCDWTSTSNDSWITVTLGATGSGSGTVSFLVGANIGAQRAGTITIAGQTFTVTQSALLVACAYSIDPTSVPVPALGLLGALVTVTTTPGCAWTGSSQASWLTIITGTSGSGSGLVLYNAGANAGPARNGTMTIGGQTFTASQASGCSFSIDPASKKFSAHSGTGTTNVVAQAGCEWTAVSNDSWIDVTDGASGSGNGTVAYAVDANPLRSDRTGTITIATKTYTVTQDH